MERACRIPAPSISELRVRAKMFRAAIEAAPKQELSIGFQRFPLGACGDTAFLLAVWLHEEGLPGVSYVAGERGRQTHAWVEVHDIVVDITADQFDDCQATVIVEKQPTFHQTFVVTARKPPGFEKYEFADPISLENSYTTIRSILERNFEGGVNSPGSSG